MTIRRGERAPVPHHLPSEPEYRLPASLVVGPRHGYRLVLAVSVVLVIGLLMLTGLVKQHGARPAMGSNDGGEAYPSQHTPRSRQVAPGRESVAGARFAETAPTPPHTGRSGLTFRPVTSRPPRHRAETEPSRPSGSPMSTIPGLPHAPTSTLSEPFAVITEPLESAITPPA
jgi:hypothetical protein